MMVTLGSHARKLQCVTVSSLQVRLEEVMVENAQLKATLSLSRPNPGIVNRQRTLTEKVSGPEQKKSDLYQGLRFQELMNPPTTATSYGSKYFTDSDDLLTFDEPENGQLAPFSPSPSFSSRKRATPCHVTGQTSNHLLDTPLVSTDGGSMISCGFGAKDQAQGTSNSLSYPSTSQSDDIQRIEHSDNTFSYVTFSHNLYHEPDIDFCPDSGTDTDVLFDPRSEPQARPSHLSPPYAPWEHKLLMDNACFIENMDAEERMEKFEAFAKERGRRGAAGWMEHYDEVVRPRFLKKEEKKGSKGAQQPIADSLKQIEHISHTGSGKAVPVRVEPVNDNLKIEKELRSESAVATGIQNPPQTNFTQRRKVATGKDESFLVFDEVSIKSEKGLTESKLALKAEKGPHVAVPTMIAYHKPKFICEVIANSVPGEDRNEPEAQEGTDMSGESSCYYEAGLRSEDLAISTHIKDPRVSASAKSTYQVSEISGGMRSDPAFKFVAADRHQAGHAQGNRPLPAAIATARLLPQDIRPPCCHRPQDVQQLYHSTFTHDPTNHRTVIISNLPATISLCTVIEKVRGGRLLCATYLETSKIKTTPKIETNTVLITFVDAKGARKCIDLVRRNGTCFSCSDGARILKAVISLRPTPIRPIHPRYIARIQEYDLSRVIYVFEKDQELDPKVTMNQIMTFDAQHDKILKYPLKAERDMNGILNLEYESIADAVNAKAAIETMHWEFRSIETGFVADPCAISPSDLKELYDEVAHPGFQLGGHDGVMKSRADAPYPAPPRYREAIRRSAVQTEVSKLSMLPGIAPCPEVPPADVAPSMLSMSNRDDMPRITRWSLSTDHFAREFPDSCRIQYALLKQGRPRLLPDDMVQGSERADELKEDDGMAREK